MTIDRPAEPRIAPVPMDTELPGMPPGWNERGVAAGGTRNIFLTLGNHPDLLRAFNRLGGFLLFKGTIPVREREIVILRVGWRARSVYEFAQHTGIGRAGGLTGDEIRRLAVDGTAGWSDADAALVRLADDLAADDCVSEATWADLAGRWTEPQLLELTVLAGFYRLVSGLLNSVGVEVEEGMPGWPASP